MGLQLTPPIDFFDLCYYSSYSIPYPPIKGFYQMKGDLVVDVLVQLKLQEFINNSFEKLDVKLPFFNRGNIKQHESYPSQGSITIASNKRELIWNIGTKFPSKSLEVQLKSTITFKGQENAIKKKSSDEYFCVDKNAYVQVTFKMNDFTLTGLNIDPTCITVTPTVKMKINIAKTISSTDFKIWNTHGDAPSSYVPDIELIKNMTNIHI